MLIKGYLNYEFLCIFDGELELNNKILYLYDLYLKLEM